MVGAATVRAAPVNVKRKLEDVPFFKYRSPQRISFNCRLAPNFRATGTSQKSRNPDG